MAPKTFDIANEVLLESSTYESKDTRSSSERRSIPRVLCLILYAMSVSMVCSIRYGFLADAFSRRHVPGKVYGVVEGSIFLGFSGCFLSKFVEFLMKRFNSKYLMVSIMGAMAASTLATGLVYRIEHNLTVIIVSTVLRILQGALSYSASLVTCDFISGKFSDKFDLINGLQNMGYYVGHGVAESVGCVLYDRFGYTAPFLLSTGMALMSCFTALLVIPKSRTYYSTQEKVTAATRTTDSLFAPSNKISKMLILPMIATMLINNVYGVLQVTVTPYLHEEFDKSISYGGGVLTFVSIGMAIGSVSAGLLLQKKLVTTYTQMALGALLVAVGLLLTFPPKSLTAFYDLSPIIAFPGVFLAGIGDPMITIATLRALYELQVQYCEKLTPQNVTLITGIWLMGYNCFYYSGSTIAGVLTDIMPYWEIAEILSGFCLISVTICVAMRYLVRNNDATDEEKVPLITGH